MTFARHYWSRNLNSWQTESHATSLVNGRIEAKHTNGFDAIIESTMAFMRILLILYIYIYMA